MSVTVSTGMDVPIHTGLVRKRRERKRRGVVVVTLVVYREQSRGDTVTRGLVSGESNVGSARRCRSEFKNTWV